MRYVSTIVNYALYGIVALFLYHSYGLQQAREKKNEEIDEANRARAEERQAAELELNTKVEKFMANIQHEVVVQVTRHDLVMCMSQLDPNCEMVQQAIADGQVKASEIGTTDQKVAELVRAYKARYTQYYASQAQ
jgi:hypothetical protein